jgi:hypothetical protein
MKSDFEYVNYTDEERLAMLETKAAELERLLRAAEPEHGSPRREAPADGGYEVPGADNESSAFEMDTTPFGLPSSFGVPEEESDDGDEDGTDDRTEALISGGRSNSAPSRLAFFRRHWRAVAAFTGAIALVVIIVAVTAGGGGPGATWPASVARMQSQIPTACQNPNVASEPSQVNFACAKGTRQVLWVFALLTSGGNPSYVDPTTGRQGLEPITPSQGGDVAWSLNLHQPYNPANAVDSLAVAARAINNIIGGATLTSSNGQPSVQAGLESTAANCQRYTGSPDLISKAGYPALCARPVTARGAQALVSDVFRQWMTGAPAQTATDAGVLFANADDPASPQVQKVLSSLPGFGL